MKVQISTVADATKAFQLPYRVTVSKSRVFVHFMHDASGEGEQNEMCSIVHNRHLNNGGRNVHACVTTSGIHLREPKPDYALGGNP